MRIVAIAFFLFGIAAFAMGIYMFIDRSVFAPLGPTMQTVLALVLIAYGVFRIWTGIADMKRIKQLSKK